jgi:hypothetical protein
MDPPTAGTTGVYLKQHHHNHNAHWMAEHKAQRILSIIHFAYPIVLLVYFLSAFTLRSILLASTDDSDHATSDIQLGPGGKPLPKKKPAAESDNTYLDFSRPRKLLFEWLALGATLTLVGNAITVIVHALYARQEEWWCGQATVVSYLVPGIINHPTKSSIGLHCRCFHGLHSDSHLHL